MVAKYLPSQEEDMFQSGPFILNIEFCYEDQLMEELTINVQTQIEGFQGRTSTHIKPKFAYSDIGKLIPFLKKLRSYKLADNEHILYMCRDGATYCGFVCAVSLLLEKLDNEGCLNVPLIVGDLKTIRPQVIPNLNQYKEVYEVVRKYFDEQDGNYFPKVSREKIKPKNITSDESKRTVTVKKYTTSHRDYTRP